MLANFQLYRDWLEAICLYQEKLAKECIKTSFSFLAVVALSLNFASVQAETGMNPMERESLKRLLEDQRWFSANEVLEKVEKREGQLSGTMLTLKKKLLKAISNLSHREVAKDLMVKEAYHGVKLALSKLSFDGEQDSLLEKLKLESSGHLAVQRAEDLYYLGNGEQALMDLERIELPIAQRLRDQISDVLDRFETALDYASKLKYGKSREIYEGIVNTIGEEGHAYVKRAHLMKRSLGSQGDIGIKMIAEGDRRVALGDRNGASAAYRRALVYVPALAYKKLEKLNSVAIELLLKASRISSENSDEARRVLEQASGLVDPEDLVLKGKIQSQLILLNGTAGSIAAE